MTTDWDAATYDRIADPQARWGEVVLDRLPLRGDERVLDAGCGSGRVTELLLARLPAGHAIALDGSPTMLEAARRRLASFGDRVSFLVADLLEPLPIDPPVDAVLSTATFHWIRDHDALFRHLAAVLRTGGWLVAQCGGAGNVASVLAAAAEVGGPWSSAAEGPWLFASAEETADRLARAGFVDVRTWLQSEPTPFEAGEPLETYLATIVLREHLARMPDADRDRYVRAVAAKLPRPEIDYVRLNIVARRGRALDCGTPSGS